MKRKTAKTKIVTAIITLVFLLIIQTVPKNPLLIFERLVKHGGFFEIILLTGYSYFIAGKLLTAGKKRTNWRLFMWLFFSVLFYLQLIIGLMGFSSFLLTGKLHLPVPFMIFSAPVFRGSGYFMIILFFSTVFVLGPAWCSYLCYFGSFDNYAARNKRPERKYSSKNTKLRLTTLFLAVSLPALLHYLDVSWKIAIIPAVVVLLIEVAIIVFYSRKSGSLVHCTSFCPVGFISNIVGRLSLFKIRFDKSCTSCYACTSTCRYGALSKENVDSKKVGFSCSICGDCVSSCPNGNLGYKLPGLSFDLSERVFTVFIVVTHVVFLAVARV